MFLFLFDPVYDASLQKAKPKPNVGNLKSYYAEVYVWKMSLTNNYYLIFYDFYWWKVTKKLIFLNKKKKIKIL